MPVRTLVVLTLAALPFGCSRTASINASPSDAPPPERVAANAHTTPKEKSMACPGMVDPVVQQQFQQEEGTWDAQVTFWFQPGAEPVRTACTMTSRTILSGMFLEQAMNGGTFGPALGNAAWSARSITGYNTSTGALEVVRLGSSNSTMIIVTGRHTPGEQRTEVAGEYQMMGMTCTERDVTVMDGPDRRRVESFMKFGDSPEFKGAEITLTRRK